MASPSEHISPFVTLDATQTVNDAAAKFSNLAQPKSTSAASTAAADNAVKVDDTVKSKLILVQRRLNQTSTSSAGHMTVVKNFTSATFKDWVFQQLPNLMVNIYSEHKAKIEQATNLLHYCEAFLLLHKDNAMTLFFLAMLNKILGNNIQSEEQVRNLKTKLSHDNGNADAHFYASAYYHVMGDIAAASKHAELAKTLLPAPQQITLNTTTPLYTATLGNTAASSAATTAATMPQPSKISSVVPVSSDTAAIDGASPRSYNPSASSQLPPSYPPQTPSVREWFASQTAPRIMPANTPTNPQRNLTTSPQSPNGQANTGTFCGSRCVIL